MPPEVVRDIRSLRGSAGLADRGLVEAAREGDVAAFEEIYARYHRRILAHATRRLGDRSAAEDVMHDTFLRAFTRIWQLRSPEHLFPWLRAITSRLCVDHQRSSSRVIPMSDIGSIADDEDPLEYMRDPEERAAVRCALARLPERQRRVLVGHVLEELSCRELAEREDTSELAIKSLLFRARSGFRGAWRGAVAVLGARAARRAAREPQTLVGRVRYALPAVPVIGLSLAMVVPATMTPTLPTSVREGSRVASPAPALTGLGSQVPGVPLSPAIGEMRVTDGNGIASLIDGLSPEDLYIRAVATSPAFAEDSTLFALGTTPCAPRCVQILLRSEDAGRTWRALPSRGLISDILILPPTFGPDDQTLYAASRNGVQVSRDAGASFQTVTPVIPTGVERAVVSPRFGRGDDRIVLGGTQVVEYRPNSGLTVVPGPGIGPLHPNLVEDALGIDLLVGSLGYTNLTARSAKVESCRSGTCRRLIEPGWPVVPRFAKVTDPSVSWAVAGTDEIYLSSTQGATRRVTVPNGWITGLVVTPEVMLAIDHGDVPGLRMSRDGGLTWTRPEIPGGFYSTITVVDDLVLVGGRGQIWCSNDLGQTFRRRCS